jgi:hypothetical protein
MTSNPSTEFLQALFEPNDRICAAVLSGKQFQTSFAKCEEACTDEFQAKLQAKNQSGMNVYITMNPILEGHDRRRKDDIGEIRTVYLDIDTDGKAKLAAINASKEVPEPTFVLESSPGKYQVIWSIRGINKDQQEHLLKSLITKFGGDPAASDCCRVLRIPGFVNAKYNPAPMVNIVHANGVHGPYSIDDFLLDVKSGEIQKRPWEVYGFEVEGPEIPLMQHDITLHSIAGKLRSMKWEEPAIYDRLEAICTTRIPTRGTDWEAMCKKHSVNICKKPAGLTPDTYVSNQTVVETISEEQFRNPVKVKKTLAEYPLWVWEGTVFDEFADLCAVGNYIPKEFFIESLKTIIGAICGHRIQPHRSGGQQPSRFYTTIIAPPGIGKSTGGKWGLDLFLGTGLLYQLSQEGAYVNIGCAVGAFASDSGMKKNGFMKNTRILQVYDEATALIEKFGIDGSGGAFLDAQNQLFEHTKSPSCRPGTPRIWRKFEFRERKMRSLGNRAATKTGIFCFPFTNCSTVTSV